MFNENLNPRILITLIFFSLGSWILSDEFLNLIGRLNLIVKSLL